MLEVFDLKDKAIREDLLITFTGDAAALSTTGNEAGQCLFRLKIIDGDDIDLSPVTFCYANTFKMKMAVPRRSIMVRSQQTAVLLLVPVS